MARHDLTEDSRAERMIALGLRKGDTVVRRDGERTVTETVTDMRILPGGGVLLATTGPAKRSDEA